MNVILLILAWCLLAVIFAIRFSFVPRFSASERARLARQGDKIAIEERKYLLQLPRLQSLLRIIRIVMTALFIALAMYLYSVVTGFIIGVLLVVVVPLAFRLRVVEQLAGRLQSILQPGMIRLSESFAPGLRLLRDRDVALPDTALNSQAELLELAKRSPGVLSREEYARLVANLQFDDKKVADIMTPRSVIDALPVSETLGPLVLDELYKTGHSRFPVYKGDLDHIVGMLYVRDLLDLKQGSQPAKDAMHGKVYFIREDRDLSHALHGFLSTHHHLFVVVNAYRETVGLLSLEDVVEALLGTKIQDEFDAFDDLRAVAEHNPHGNNLPASREDI